MDGLKVLQGDSASNIDMTYSLAQKGLHAFVKGYVKVVNDPKNKKQGMKLNTENLE